MSDSVLNIGLDAGSTTIKIVVVNNAGEILFKEYRRHHADIAGALISIFGQLKQSMGDRPASLTITGSAGMGIAERCKLPFIQEVVASCEVVSQKYPQIKTLVDIGGEDAKMIFFSEKNTPDMRMNGSCAGGTGSFIDQMANILAVDISELNNMAERATTIDPIASRCGVFSKTDVQNLLSRNVSKDDIAASVFHAVSIQIITSLSRGYKITPKLFLCGGPFTFIPQLRKAFIEAANLMEEDIVISDYAEVVPALGAALASKIEGEHRLISEYIALFLKMNDISVVKPGNRNRPLFDSKAEFEEWSRSKIKFQLDSVEIENIDGTDCYIGVDSGSTTTKIIALDKKGRLFFHFYRKNCGNSLETVREGFELLNKEAGEAGKSLNIKGSCVTGYGEDLIKKAFNLNWGMVETIAHYTAACHFNPAVSFILDIGGQDMKATFIENGAIKRLEINEACSSGCGCFIETFSNSLNFNIKDFSEIACSSDRPCDLGTRCTVFMNSKVKQYIREGSSVADIFAGLAYSVIKNCLNKVLKIKDVSELGDNIMVQGGTFRNKAIIRAFEKETGKSVMITDYPELMGAYGAALFAKKSCENRASETTPLIDLVNMESHKSSMVNCRGCENCCTVTRYDFVNGNRYYSGNKCEKIFNNAGERKNPGVNQYAEKLQLLFDRELSANFSAINPSAKTIGIPRALGIYENYPFWHKLFTGCGFNVILSDESTVKMYEKGANTVMADNICYPAKLVNGHIFNLINKKVDRIFLPFVVYEGKEDKTATNSYNCPIVTGYSEVIRSAVDPLSNHGIPFDSPAITFKDERLLKKGCFGYIQSISTVQTEKFNIAFREAIKEQESYNNTLVNRAAGIYEKAKRENRMVILLAGRPYHTDPLIQHKIAEILAGYGVDVITEAVAQKFSLNDKGIHTIMQWAYINRIVKSAQWAAEAPANVQYLEITSFGCGPDAFILDEVSDILRSKGKNATILKVDDISNTGSIRLRIRSLIESLKFNLHSNKPSGNSLIQISPFEKSDKRRKILLPWFGDFYSPFIPPLFRLMGYDCENLPPSDQQSAEYGLKYSNNEICYPATLIVGDFIKALESGRYDTDKVALAITQTGGQCRATNYLSLVKKAMISAGFTDVPIISIATDKSSTINNQPGFRLKWERVYKLVINTTLFADYLSQMYYATAPRESETGIAVKLKDKYINLGIGIIERNKPDEFFNLAASAAKEFSSILGNKNIPRIGVVGEIYVKYNDFGHKNIIKWLISQGVEPVLPAITDFFTAFFANREIRFKDNIQRRNIPKFALDFVEKYLFGVIREMEHAIKQFPYIRPIKSPHKEAQMASKIINTNSQFGEGWGIAGEFARFAEEGINNVVSLQPFGCIANQIISKGIEKRTRELYPNLNLLFLDFDNGMSEANIYNRLHFMIRKNL
ncbi:MAG: acyl-CoA dehydratase activase-related protein [Bacteroidales bacterium]